MRRLTGQERTTMLIIAVVGMLYAIVAMAGLIGSQSCQAFEVNLQPIGAVQFLLGMGTAGLGQGANGCTVPSVVLAMACAALVIVLAVVGVMIAVRVGAHRQTPQYLRSMILRRKEIAGRAEILREMGEKTAVKRGKQVRPGLASPDVDQVAWKLGESTGVDVWLSMEDPLVVIGPPRAGKGYNFLTAAIMEAPGAVVTTSSRGDNMEATIMARAEKGPVYLFDPEGVTGRRTTMSWSPIRGCESPKIAQKRAGVLVAGTGLSSGQNQEWAGKAADILQCLLHAAALGDVPLGELHRWTKSPVFAEPAIGILEEKSTTGWHSILEGVLNLDARSRDSQWFGVQSSLSALDVPTVRDVMDVRQHADLFDPQEFLTSSGTLYLVTELRQSVNTPGGVGVFFSMILDDIYEAAHRLSQQSLGGRLDPPCMYVLDEIANIHPWKGLPQAMAAGSGEGVQVIPVFQSRHQAREGWGDKGEGTIWDSATRKLILGGASDTSDLRSLSDILGTREEITRSESYSSVNPTSYSEQMRERPVLSIDELRRLPQTTALLLAGRSRPILLDLVPWPERPWAKQVTESKKWHTEHPAAVGDSAQRADTYTREAAHGIPTT